MNDRITTYFSHELTEQEKIALLRKANADPKLKRELLALQNACSLLALSSTPSDTAAGNNSYRYLMQLRSRERLKRLVMRAVSYAAAIALLVVATWQLAIRHHPTAPTEILMVAGMQELYVPAGQHARITLPDGSMVWLNAGSTLRYPSVFSDERNVSLTGEGFFDVAQNPDKPFIVSTHSIDIEALGTRFNVQSYPQADIITTSLVEGAVKVYEHNNEGGGKVLSPNQKLCYQDGLFRMGTIDSDKLLWIDGIYSFKKERLDVIIEMLELYYDVDIIVKNPRILQYEYTGKFRQRDGVVEILRIIQKIHNFKIQKDETLNRITLY